MSDELDDMVDEANDKNMWPNFDPEQDYESFFFSDDSVDGWTETAIQECAKAKGSMRLSRFRKTIRLV